MGGDDPAVLQLNVEALRTLGGLKEMVVVPRATHLFEEPGALEAVAGHAAEWFKRYLPRVAGAREPAVAAELQ